MKYIKLFEAYITAKSAREYPELVKKYKFKIGDYVRVPTTNSTKEIFEIVAIDTNDDHQPYQLKDLRSNGAVYAISSDNFELVPDYEMNAIKYNI